MNFGGICLSPGQMPSLENNLPTPIPIRPLKHISAKSSSWTEHYDFDRMPFDGTNGIFDPEECCEKKNVQNISPTESWPHDPQSDVSHRKNTNLKTTGRKSKHVLHNLKRWNVQTKSTGEAVASETEAHSLHPNMQNNKNQKSINSKRFGEQWIYVTTLRTKLVFVFPFLHTDPVPLASQLSF